MNNFIKKFEDIPIQYSFFIAAIIISAIVSLFACKVSFASPVNADIAMANEADQVITVHGHGFASAEAVELGNVNYCKVMAADAAKGEAYAALVEKINGIQVDAESKIVNHRTVSRTVNQKVSGLIAGADVIAEDYSDDGMSCTVTLQLKVTNKSNPAESLTAAVMPQDYVKESFPTPRKNGYLSMAADPAVETYTGVIIDCSNMGLKTAMSPVIKDNTGRKLYGYKNLDSTYICKYGMAGYTSVEDNNVSRAGNNPLVIKATSVENCANPVITEEQGERMLVANQKTHFLDNCAVVFIR